MPLFFYLYFSGSSKGHFANDLFFCFLTARFDSDFSLLVTSEEFSAFFEQFGVLADSIVMFNRETGRPRGFGFVTFEDVADAKRVLGINDDNEDGTDAQPPLDQKSGGKKQQLTLSNHIEMRGKMIEVKPAFPREYTYFSGGSGAGTGANNKQRSPNRRSGGKSHGNHRNSQHQKLPYNDNAVVAASAGPMTSAPILDPSGRAYQLPNMMMYGTSPALPVTGVVPPVIHPVVTSAAPNYSSMEGTPTQYDPKVAGFVAGPVPPEYLEQHQQLTSEPATTEAGFSAQAVPVTPSYYHPEANGFMSGFIPPVYYQQQPPHFPDLVAPGAAPTGNVQMGLDPNLVIVPPQQNLSYADTALADMPYNETAQHVSGPMETTETEATVDPPGNTALATDDTTQ